MPRTRRYIRENKPYELILRVKDCIPFVPNKTVNAIIKSALSRSLRDNKITLCHFLWMGNHPHIIFIAHNPQDCVNFYQELQKKITDSFKRLLGKHRLSLWEGDSVLAEILDPHKMIEKIAYLYANPARASLTDSVTEYPGLSSWRYFSTGSDLSLTNIPWIRLPAIQELPSLHLSPSEDEQVCRQMTDNSTVFHDIPLVPDAWMECFGIVKDSDKLCMNRKILEILYTMESGERSKRAAQGRSVIGARRLINASLMKSHEPKKSERRVYVHSSDRELRISYIQMIREFCRKCKECYELYKKGESVVWPPGAFRPSAPPLIAPDV